MEKSGAGLPRDKTGAGSFIDRARIFIQAGKGGDGALSFRREKFIPRGGPNGGNGGSGGSVTLTADPGLRTLLELQRRPHWRAQNGDPGRGNNCTGASGEDLEIRVPCGTIVLAAGPDSSERFVADLVEPGRRVVVARGGRGGRGNASFKSGRNTAPRIAENGEPGEELTLELELKLLADAGLVGFPNAGKSTFLSVVSQARPKIAAYPFTTLSPNLGVVSRGEANFVLADVPGLIEGASQGKGLGLEFLRHIERTRVLVHILDVWGYGDRDAYENFQATRRELKAYSSELARRPQIVVVNKLDLPGSREKLLEFKRRLKGRAGGKIFEVSCVKRQGLEPVLAEIARRIRKEEAAARRAARAKTSEGRTEVVQVERPFQVSRDQDAWVVEGKTVERWVAMTRMGEWQAVERLQKRLRAAGVERALKRSGCKPGDRVRIGGYEFVFQE